MGNKIIKSIMLYSSLLFISGCSFNTPFSTQPIAGTKVDDGERIEEVIDKKEVTNQQMKIFFSKFLKLNHEDILVLNQKPKEINDEYWKAYGIYQEKINGIIGEYLSSSAKNKLKKQYLHDDFHFPRFIELNDYMIIGISELLDATIMSKQIKGISSIYEVELDVLVDVIDLDWAHRKDAWNNEEGYYIREVFIGSDIYEEELGLDKIKVAMNYLVEVPEGEVFTVDSVKEKIGLYLGMDEQSNTKNNQFISRLPLIDTVGAREEEIIHAFINTFLNQDYSFYDYYRKVHVADYDTFRFVLENDLGLKNIVSLYEDNYKAQFKPSIIPLKDNMESLYFDVKKDVLIVPHISSSANLSAYQVDIGAQVTFINGRVAPYQYTYLIILDRDLKVSSIKLIRQEEVNAGKIDLDLRLEQ